MPRKKQIKMDEARTLPNVFEYSAGDTEGELSDYLGNDNPVILEVGCGEGNYTINLARQFPGKNFVGVDMRGARIHTGARTAIEENLYNVTFIWIKAENLADFFKEKTIDEIFIPFPEPHVKRRSENRRLVSGKFLGIYKKILKPRGKINLKTDDEGLYKYSIDLLRKNNIDILFNTDDLYANDKIDEIKKIKTRYEKHYLQEGRKIKFIRFRLS